MIYDKFDIILEVLMLLTALVECRSPHNNYLKCLRNICDTALSVNILATFSISLPTPVRPTSVVVGHR